MADSGMKPTETGLRMEGQSIHVFSLKEEPGATHVNLLDMKFTSFLAMRSSVVNSGVRRVLDAVEDSFPPAAVCRAARFSFISLMTKKPKEDL